MNTLIKSYIEEYYNNLILEGINFSDLDDSSEDEDLAPFVYNKYKAECQDNLSAAIQNNDDNLYKETFNKILYLYKLFNKPIYVATYSKLLKLIYKHIELYGNNCDLNWIDTHNITTMFGLFAGNMDYETSISLFDGDISKWDMSNVEDMACMFSSSAFNGDISKWDVSKVNSMSMMFSSSAFNGDISNWNVSNVQNMDLMFYKSAFNQDIHKWDIKAATKVNHIFENCPIKNEYIPISYKNNLKFLHQLEEGINFQDLEDSDDNTLADNIYKNYTNIINNIVQKQDAFSYKQIFFNLQKIYNIYKIPIYTAEDKNILSDLINFHIKVFQNDKCDLNWIDVSHMTNMKDLFIGSLFNGDISNWDVSNVINMEGMFQLSAFNGDISNWDVSNVINMAYMFAWSDFNQNINNWNISNVKYMRCMFRVSNFNLSLNNWDVQNVIDMNYMFCKSNFSLDIHNWKLNPKVQTEYMYGACDIPEQYKAIKKD